MSTYDEKVLKFLYHDETPRTGVEITYYIDGSVRKAGEVSLSLQRLEKSGLVVRASETRKNEHNLSCQVKVYRLSELGKHQHELFLNSKERKVKRLDFRNHIISKSEASKRL